jgi:hypothetical protein
MNVWVKRNSKKEPADPRDAGDPMLSGETSWRKNAGKDP